MGIQRDITIDDRDAEIDNRLDSYDSFYDCNWACLLFQLTENTKLYPFAFDLCADWKGAGNTGRLPWLLINSLESFYTGFTKTNEPFWEKLSREFRKYILDKTKHSFNLTKQKELIRIINELNDEVQKR